MQRIVYATNIVENMKFCHESFNNAFRRQCEKVRLNNYFKTFGFIRSLIG